MILRRAALVDVPFIADELKVFSGQLGTVVSLYPDELQVIAKLEMLVSTHVFYVVENDGEVIGFICGLLAPHFLNDDIIQLTEVLWWVRPEHRLSRASLLLFDAFMDAGKRYAHWIVMTFQAMKPVMEPKLLDRGFTMTEQCFLYEVKR